MFLCSNEQRGFREERRVILLQIRLVFVAVGCLAVGGLATAASEKTKRLEALFVEGQKAFVHGEKVVLSVYADALKKTLLSEASNWERLLTRHPRHQVLPELSLWVMAYCVFKSAALGSSQQVSLTKDEEARLTKTAPTFRSVLKFLKQATEVAQSLSSSKERTVKLTRRSLAEHLQTLNPDLENSQILAFLRDGQVKENWKRLHSTTLTATPSMNSNSTNSSGSKKNNVFSKADAQPSSSISLPSSSDWVVPLDKPLLQEGFVQPKSEAASSPCREQSPSQPAGVNRPPAPNTPLVQQQSQQQQAPQLQTMGETSYDPALVLLTGTMLTCLSTDPQQKKVLKEQLSLWIQEKALKGQHPGEG